MLMQIRVCILVGVITLVSSAADLPKLLNNVKNFQVNYQSKNDIAAILEVAKSEDYEALVVQCMVVYTLYAGSIGDAATCQGAFQSVCKRYPNSEAVQYLKGFYLFPDPCVTCQGVGIVGLKSEQGCSTCNKTGICSLCGGKGLIKEKTGFRGPVRIGTWYAKKPFYNQDGTYSQQRAPVANYGNSEATKTEPLNARCPVCSGSGKCRSCKGFPMKESTITTLCPTCNGSAKGVNAEVAKVVLEPMTKVLGDSIQQTLDCEAAYEKAMLTDDPFKQLDALNVCLARFENAYNKDVVRETKNALEKDVVEFKKLQEKTESERLAKKTQQEEQRRLVLQQHETTLKFIQEAKVHRTALEQIQTFIAENPDSPVIVKAKLLLAEIEQRLADEHKTAQRNRYLVLGGIALLVFSGLGWLLSCIRFTRKVEITKIEITPPSRFPTAQHAQAKIPFKPKHTLPSTTVLQLATQNTAKDMYAECPECGALLECPPSVQNMTATCGSCKKMFNVD